MLLNGNELEVYKAFQLRIITERVIIEGLKFYLEPQTKDQLVLDTWQFIMAPVNFHLFTAKLWISCAPDLIST